MSTKKIACQCGKTFEFNDGEQKYYAERSYKDPKHCAECRAKKKKEKNAEREAKAEQTRPDWSGKCLMCDGSPIVPLTGMCGPCTFGEAETIGGNW